MTRARCTLEVKQEAVRLAGQCGCRTAQILAQLSEIEEPVDAAQEVIARHAIFEIECVEQRMLNNAPTPHDAYLSR